MSLKRRVAAALSRWRVGSLSPGALSYRTTSVRYAVATAALCAVAGATATVPLYGVFWWWDLLSHALAGGALAAVAGLVVRSRPAALAVVVTVAAGWEAVEPHLPTGSLPIWFATGDAPSDLAATAIGGVVVCLLVPSRGWAGR
jgi:hypothetical protein